MKDDSDLNLALQQLEIRTQNKADDRAELRHILYEILCYPSIEEAEKHHTAHMLGVNDKLDAQKQLQRKIRQNESSNLAVCSCCGLLTQNQQLPYCTSLDDLKIGVGVHLYFRSLLYNTILFFLMLLIYSVYALVTNIEAYNLSKDKSNIICFLQDDGCGLSDIGTGSKILLQSAIKETVQIQSILGIVFVVLWSLMNVIKIHRQKLFFIDMQTKRISASDFTLMITNFPKIYLLDSYDKNLIQLQNIFKRYQKQVHSVYSYEVIKYNVAKPLYNEAQINKERKGQLKKQLEDRQQVFRRWLSYRKDHINFPIPHANRNVEYENYIKFFTQEYDLPSLRDVPLEEQNIIFVTFRSSKAREEIQNMNKPPSWKNLWNICHQNNFPIKGVTIIRAPQPEEIKWENVGFPACSKIWRKLFVLLITVVLICVSLGISIGVAFIDFEANPDFEGYHQYVSIVVSLIVTVFNIGIQMSIMYLSYLENEIISSVEQSNIALKIGIGQLFNSIGVPLVIAAIKVQQDTRNFLVAGGLVEDVFWIALFSLFSPIGRFIDPFNIFLDVKRWYYEDPARRIKMFGQKELNCHYGNYEFDIGYEYAYIIKTSIFTAFFVPMQPIIAIFAPIGLGLYYLANKRNLFRHFQRPTYHQHAINSVVDMILLLSPIAFGFGHLTVVHFIPQNNDNTNSFREQLILDWIMTIIGIVFFFLVPLKIFYCCISQPEYDHWDYLQKKPVLHSDYDRLNPITRAQAINDFEIYLNKLDDEKKLPDEAEMIKFKVSQVRFGNDRQKQFSNSIMHFNMSSMQNNQNLSPSYNQNIDQYKSIIKGDQDLGSANQLYGKRP